MKLLLTIWSCILLTAVSAQQTENDKNTSGSRATIMTEVDTAITTPIDPDDTAKIIKQKTIIKRAPEASIVDIPTLKMDTSKTYPTPVKTLYGHQLAPMPGTEKLDSLDKRNAMAESTPYPKILIKTSSKNK